MHPKILYKTNSFIVNKLLLEMCDAEDAITNKISSSDDFENRINDWKRYVNDDKNNPCHEVILAKRLKPNNSGDIKCDVGDSILFSSLLCYSGDAFSCDAIKNSQKNGRWWRSPYHEQYTGSATSFSKDAALGVLLYFVVASRTDPEGTRKQAEDWLAYINSNGIVLTKVILGVQEEEQKLLDLARDVGECRSGSLDACVDLVDEISPTVKIWRTLRHYGNCAVHGLPGVASCFEKDVEHIKIPTALTFALNSICPDNAGGACNLTPRMWYVFYHVYKHLNISPTLSMRLANKLYEIRNYNKDEIHQSDEEPHLKFVTALILQELQEPGLDASYIIDHIYSDLPTNLIFQYAYGKYVNPNLYSPEQLRTNLLLFSPLSLYNAANQFVGAGDTWLWQAKDNQEMHNNVNNSMGWDFLLISNLILQKFNLDLDFYIANYLKNTVGYYTKQLAAVLPVLLSEHKKFINFDLKYLDLVGQAEAIVNDPEVTYSNLQQLTQMINQWLTGDCNISYGTLQTLYDRTIEFYNVLQTLQANSRIKFQNAYRIPEYNTFWKAILLPYKTLASQLAEINTILEKYHRGDYLCADMLRILTQIILVTEREHTSGIKDDFKRINSAIIQHEKSERKQDEYNRAKLTFGSKIDSLIRALQKALNSADYTTGEDLILNSESLYNSAFKETFANAALLTSNDKKVITKEFKDLLNKNIDDWKGYVSQVGAAKIVETHLEILIPTINQFINKIIGQPETYLQKLFFAWHSDMETPVPTSIGGGSYNLTDVFSWILRPNLVDKNDQIVSIYNVYLNKVESMLNLYSKIEIPAIATNLADIPKATGLVFDVTKRGTCSSNTDGYYDGCNIPRSITFKAAPVSHTNDEEIKKLSYINRLAIDFNCATRESGAAKWILNDQEGYLAAIPTSELKIDIPISYSGSPLKIEIIDFDVRTTFEDFCRLNVINNFNYPETKTLSLYADNLINFDDQLTQVYKASIPGASARNVVESLDSAIKVLNLLITSFQVCFKDYLYQMKITKQHLETANATLTKCITDDEGTDHDRICSETIRDIQRNVTTQKTAFHLQLESLKNFLTAESTRIEVLDTSLFNELSRINIKVHIYPSQLDIQAFPSSAVLPPIDERHDGERNTVTWSYYVKSANVFTHLLVNEWNQKQTLNVVTNRPDEHPWQWQGWTWKNNAPSNCGDLQMPTITQQKLVQFTQNYPTVCKNSDGTYAANSISVTLVRSIMSGEVLEQYVHSRPDDTIEIKVALRYAVLPGKRLDVTRRNRITFMVTNQCITNVDGVLHGVIKSYLPGNRWMAEDANLVINIKPLDYYECVAIRTLRSSSFLPDITLLAEMQGPQAVEFHYLNWTITDFSPRHFNNVKNSHGSITRLFGTEYFTSFINSFRPQSDDRFQSQANDIENSLIPTIQGHQDNSNSEMSWIDSVHNCPSINEQLTLINWVIGYLGRWLPWNQQKKVSKEDIDILSKHKQQLISLSKEFDAFKNTIVNQCKLFNDKFVWVKNKITGIHCDIKEIYVSQSCSQSTLSEIRNTITLIKDELRNLSEKEVLLKEWKRKAIELTKENKEVKVCYNATLDTLTFKIQTAPASEPLLDINLRPIIESTNPAALATCFGLNQKFWGVVKSTEGFQLKATEFPQLHFNM